MGKLIYNIISMIAEKHDLLWLIQEYREYLPVMLMVLAIISCLIGFYCYRGIVSVLVFGMVAAIGGIWIRPAYGQLAAAAFCAILGVVLPFLAYRWQKFGAILISALVGGSLIWLALDGKYALPAIWFAAGIAGLFSGILAYLFPFWSICIFTALWGGTYIAAEYNVPQGILLMIAGCAAQLFLFRRQKLFPKIMPKKLEQYFWQRKQEVGH